MNPYLAVFKARFATLIQYRAAAVAGIGTQIFWGLIRMMIIDAFYRSSTAPQPMNVQEAITYVWLGQALLMMMPFTSNPDPDIRQMIRTGSVAYELTRPLDLYCLWFSRSVAGRLAPTLLRAPPQFALAIAFWSMTAPPSAASLIAWMITTFGALLLVSSLATLVTITMLWTVSGEGIARLMPSFSMALSGLIVPLPLYPDWAQPLLQFLPFSGMADGPFRLYIGSLPPAEMVRVLTHQIIWTAIFILAGRILLAKGVRRLEMQGG